MHKTFFINNVISVEYFPAIDFLCQKIRTFKAPDLYRYPISNVCSFLCLLVKSSDGIL